MNTMTTTKTEALLRDAAQTALLTLDGIADASPRDKDSFETPADWIAWEKSRARFAADALRGPLARELHAERVLRQMLEEDRFTHPSPTQPTQPAKCDGNHGGPRCADPECWNDLPPDAQGLPKLPKPNYPSERDYEDSWTADQMRAYALQSIAQATQQAAGQAGEVVAYACPDELELMKQRTVKHCLLSTFPAHGGKDVALYTRPAAVPDGWQDVIERMVKGIDHLAELARQWEPDHSSGADRRGWVLAKDARDDALRLLQTAKPSNAAVPEWQPIETAPKDGTDMALLFARDDFVLGQAYSRVRCGSFVAGKDWGFPYHRDNPPTHWMPLPPAPLQAAKGAV